MKFQEKFSAKKVSFATSTEKIWDCSNHYFLPLPSSIFMQASTSLKDAFLSVSKPTSEGASSTIPEELGENPKKKAKIAGAV